MLPSNYIESGCAPTLLTNFGRMFVSRLPLNTSKDIGARVMKLSHQKSQTTVTQCGSQLTFVHVILPLRAKIAVPVQCGSARQICCHVYVKQIAGGGTKATPFVLLFAVNKRMVNIHELNV